MSAHRRIGSACSLLFGLFSGAACWAGCVQPDAYEVTGQLVVTEATGERGRWGVELVGTTRASLAAEDGTFTIGGIPRGPWTLRAYANVGGENREREVLVPLDLSGTAPQVEVGTLSLAPIARLTGRVLRNGAPPRRAWVGVNAQGAIQADDTGAFVLHLPPGTHDVVAFHVTPDGLRAHTTSIRLDADLEHALDVDDDDPRETTFSGHLAGLGGDDGTSFRVIAIDMDGVDVPVSAGGAFVSPLLPVGPYTLRFEGPGHRTSYRGPLMLGPGARWPAEFLTPDTDECDGDGLAGDEDPDDDGDGLVDADEAEACRCNRFGPRLPNETGPCLYIWSAPIGVAAGTVTSRLPEGAGANPESITIEFRMTSGVDPATWTASNVRLLQGSTEVPLALTAVESHGRATPARRLQWDTDYEVVLSGLLDQQGLRIEAQSWTFRTAPYVDLDAPHVRRTEPANGETGIALEGTLAVEFDAPVQVPTVVASLRMDGGDPLPLTALTTGTVATRFEWTYSGLEQGRLYFFRIAAGVADVAGNTTDDHTGVGFTSWEPDTYGPRLVATFPTSGRQDVGTRPPLVFEFNEPLAAAPLVTANPPIEFTTRLDGKRLIIDTGPLTAGTAYRFRAWPPLADALGNVTDREYDLEFTTAAFEDTTAPVFQSARPAEGWSGISPTTTVRFFFDDILHPFDGALTSDPPLTWVLIPDDGKRMVEFVPADGPLAPWTTYSVTLAPGLRNESGVATSQAVSLSFTTGP